MSERNPPAQPAFDIPDLVLEPAASRRPAETALARPATAQAPLSDSDSLDAAGDDFELMPLGASVELSLGQGSQIAGAAREVASWPTGRSRGVEQLRIDAAEVALVADYGSVPHHAWLTPLYAYRVFKRRKPLKQAIALNFAQLGHAELQRTLALMQLSTSLRPALEANDAFRRLLEPIREIERLAGERQTALSAADSGYREQMAHFDSELAQLQSREGSARADCDAKAATKNATENELRRAEAQQQRVQIETRSVMDVARQALGPAGGEMPPAQAAQLAALQARSTDLEPELNQVKHSNAAAQAAFQLSETELQRVRAQIRQLERQRTSAGSALEKQLSARAAGVSEAEQQRRDALAEVARAILSARGAVSVPELTLEALRGHDDSVEACAIRLETHVRALDSRDRARVKQGVILVLSACGAVLLLVLLKAVF